MANRIVTAGVMVMLAFCRIVFAAGTVREDDEKRIMKYGTTAEKIVVLDRIRTGRNSVLLPAAAELLDDSSRDVRRKASETLLAVGDGTCTGFYQKALRDSWYQVRLNAIKGLVLQGEGDILSDFTQALDDTYCQVRLYAAAGLGKYGDETVFDRLLSHLSDVNPLVQDELLRAINRLLWRDEARVLFRKTPDDQIAPLFTFLTSKSDALKIRALWVIDAAGDRRAVPSLIKTLDDKNDEIKIRALWALERLGADESSGAVEGLLTEPSLKLKVEAIRTLVRLKAKENVEGLTAALTNDRESEDVKIFALWALERFDQPVTYPEITAALGDSSERVRGYAASVIQRTKSRRGYCPLLEGYIGDRGNPREARLTAMSLLGTLGDEGEKEFLFAQTKNDDAAIRKGALAALSALDPGDPELLRALGTLERSDSSSAVRGEARKLIERATAVILRSLDSTDADRRAAACSGAEALNETGNAPIILKAMARSDYPDVREKMVEIARTRPDDVLRKELRVMAKDQDPAMRDGAVRALGLLKDGASVPTMREGLKSDDPDRQLACAWALAQMGMHDGSSVAVSALKSGNPEMQKTGAEIIGRLGEKEYAPALLRLLADSELDVKVSCAWALANMGESRGVETLVNLSQENIEPVRTQAQRYLREQNIQRLFGDRIEQLRKELARRKIGVREISARNIPAGRVSAAIDVDGKIEEQFWQSRLESAPFILTGADKVPAGALTKVAVGYDDTKFYALFVCDDPDAGSLGRSGRDFVTLAINPRNSAKRWYQFVVHPKNDIRYAYVWKLYTGDDEDSTWTSNWKSAATMEGDRWIVEMSVPLADLGIEGIAEGTEWNINFQRESDHLPTATWTGRMDNPEQFGMVVFGERP